MKTTVNLSFSGTSQLTNPTQSTDLIDQDFICTLFNISTKDVMDLHCVRNTGSGNTSIFIKLSPTYPPCPQCGAPAPSIKDYYTRRINHSVLSNSCTQLYYKDRRYICGHCHKTYFAQSPFTENGFRHSILTTTRVLEDLKDPNMTMAAVARRHHISSTTVANIFDAHVDIGRHKLPRFLSIDEVYAFKSNKSKYICVLLDYKNRVPVDILNARTYDELMRFFSAIPLEERENVKFFSTDMWDTYRRIARRYLPQALIIVDRFHVIQECNKRLDRIRLNIQKGFHRKSNEYYLLKKFHWVLFKNDDHLLDVNREKKYNKRMKQYLNYHDIKCLLQDAHPELGVAINLKDALCLYYDTIKIHEEGADHSYQEVVPSLKLNYDGTATRRSRKLYEEANKRNRKRVMCEEEALTELEALIKQFRECPLIEFGSFATTLNKWKQEIVNSLRVYSELDWKTMSNGLIENRNKIIKNVKHTSNGYGNWRRFRNRLMYTLDKSSTYSLIANESIINRRRKSNKEYYQKWLLKNEHHKM